MRLCTGAIFAWQEQLAAFGIYLMHCWQKLNIINDLLADPVSELYRNRIYHIRKDGQTDEI